MASTVPNSEATQFKAGAKQVEIARKGGIASGEAKRRNKTMRETLEKMLAGISEKNNNLTYNELIALGLITNAIDRHKGGNPNAYRTIKETLGETEEETKTRMVEIKVVDNSHLEKVMYEKK